MLAKNLFIPITGFPNYRINCEGCIRKYNEAQFKKELYLVKHSNGTYYVNLEYDNTFILMPVNRLVAAEFVERRTKADIFIIHKDGNRSNHHASNLEWSAYPEPFKNR